MRAMNHEELLAKSRHFEESREEKEAQRTCAPQRNPKPANPANAKKTAESADKNTGKKH
jgi:hypothetical protein